VFARHRIEFVGYFGYFGYVGIFVASSVVLAATLLGCTFDTPLPKERTPVPATAPRDFRIAIVGVPVEGELACAENDCNHWYRVDVVEAGELTAVVTRRSGGTGPVIRILLNELGQPTLARAVAAPGEPLELRARVQAGVYELLVQAGMGREPYTLTVFMGDIDVPEGEGEDVP
jgi:hypothetical protein